MSASSAPRQRQPVVRQLRREQGMDIEDEGNAAPAACEERRDQALVVMRVDQIERLVLQEAPNPGQHQRVEVGQLAERRSGRGVERRVGLRHPVHAVVDLDRGVADGVRHHVDLMTESDERLGHAVDPDRRAPRPGQRTCGDHEDAHRRHGGIQRRTARQ